MPFSRIAWGLDIGESTIKAVKMRRTKAGAEIVGFDVIERGIPSDETGDKDFHLREAVKLLAERNHFAKTPVVVSIPEPAFSRFIPLPPVDRKRIPEVVRYEARQQIPFPIDEVVWDYQPVREPGEIGEETEVAIFSLRSQFVYSLLANLSLCGIQPVAVLPIPLALYNHLTFDRDIAKGTIVIDLGAGSTDILICDPENFRVRNITVSGNGITRALADRLKISPAEAEKLKRECTDKTQAARLFKLVQPVLNDLIGQVQRTIGFFKSQIHNVRIEQVMLLGNTFRLPGVDEFFVNQLGSDLMPSDALDRITLAPGVDGASVKQHLPSLIVASGLALQGIGLGRVQVNLMPNELLVRQEIGKKRIFAAAAVGCIALMLATHLLSLAAQLRQARREGEMQQDIEKFVKDLDETKKAYSTARGGVTVALDRLREPVALHTGYPKQTIGMTGCLEASNALNRVLNNLGPAITIGGVSVKPSSAFVTVKRGNGSEVSGPGVHITLSGRATRAVSGRDNMMRVSGELVDEIDAQLTKRLEEAKVTVGGATRPQFVKVERKQTDGGPRREGDEVSIRFTIDCDFLTGGQ